MKYDCTISLFNDGTNSTLVCDNDIMLKIIEKIPEYSVLLISAELNRQEIAEMFLDSKFGYKYKKGQLSNNEFNGLVDYCKKLANSRIYIEDLTKIAEKVCQETKK